MMGGFVLIDVKGKAGLVDLKVHPTRAGTGAVLIFIKAAQSVAE